MLLGCSQKLESNSTRSCHRANYACTRKCAVYSVLSTRVDKYTRSTLARSQLYITGSVYKSLQLCPQLSHYPTPSNIQYSSHSPATQLQHSHRRPSSVFVYYIEARQCRSPARGPHYDNEFAAKAQTRGISRYLVHGTNRFRSLRRH